MRARRSNTWVRFASRTASTIAATAPAAGRQKVRIFGRHASSDGIRIAIEIFLASPEIAKERLMARGVDYVAFCPNAPEMRNFTAAAPEGLAAGLMRGEVPDFLVPMPRSESPVILFRVAP